MIMIMISKDLNIKLDGFVIYIVMFLFMVWFLCGEFNILWIIVEVMKLGFWVMRI